MRQNLSLVVLLFAAAFMVGCEKTSKPVEQSQSVAQNQNKQVVEKNEEVTVTPTETKQVTNASTKVVLETNMGNIVIEMMDKNAPMTVKNFVQYVKDGFYDGVIFHRVIPGFMIQTGGFDQNMVQKETRQPVINEFNLSNVRGTVSMAKLGGNPDSATSQFFINLTNNAANLDNQNGGFTVFGKVIEGMDIVDQIASVQTTVKMGMPDAPIEPVVIKKAQIVSGS